MEKDYELPLEELPVVLQAKIMNLVRWIKSEEFQPRDGYIVGMIPEGRSEMDETGFYLPTRVVVSVKDRTLFVEDKPPLSRGGGDFRYGPRYQPPCWIFCDADSWALVAEAPKAPKVTGKVTSEDICALTPMNLQNAIFSEANYVSGKNEWKTKVGGSTYVIQYYQEVEIESRGARPMSEIWFKQYNERHPDRMRLVIRRDAREVKRLIVRREFVASMVQHPNTVPLLKPYINRVDADFDQQGIRPIYEELKQYDNESRSGEYPSPHYGEVLGQEDALNEEYGYPGYDDWVGLFQEIAHQEGLEFLESLYVAL